MKRFLPFLLVSFLSLAQIGVMKTKLTSLIIYNKGFAYAVREGEGQLENGYISLDCLPQASGGSLWIYLKQKGAYPDVIINPQENTVDFKDKSQLLASLQGKIGERLKIETTEGAVSEGKLTHILPDLLLLEGERRQVFAVNPDKVNKVVLLGYPLKLKVGGIGENEKVGITISYLQAGLSWEPNYLLYLTSDKEAMLTLRATVVNNIEDWQDITCYFAVGMPNFPWRTIIDPLISRGLMVFTDGGIMAMQAQIEKMEEKAGGYGGYAAAGAPPPPVSLGREELTTLYLYKKEGFSLKKGEAGAVTIFTTAVPYKHLYSWDVDAKKISHLLSFTNKSDVPLVPGSILAVEGGNPLGQDHLSLTPSGGEARITLGLAGELEGKIEETEISREITRSPKEEMTYVKRRIKGTLELRNFSKKEVEVEVTKKVVGEVISSTPQAKVSVISPDVLNPTNKLFWTVKVPAQGKVELVYEYYFIQSTQGLPPIVEPSLPEGGKKGE
ncbi:MAG: DUF4139 domain-containing protein [bacterium]